MLVPWSRWLMHQISQTQQWQDGSHISRCSALRLNITELRSTKHQTDSLGDRSPTMIQTIAMEILMLMKDLSWCKSLPAILSGNSTESHSKGIFWARIWSWRRDTSERMLSWLKNGRRMCPRNPLDEPFPQDGGVQYMPTFETNKAQGEPKSNKEMEQVNHHLLHQRIWLREILGRCHKVPSQRKFTRW